MLVKFAGKRAEVTMEDFEKYKEKLEKQFGKDLKEILVKYYIFNDLGPSLTAKKLGVPRQAILHYIHVYGLKPVKHEQIKQKSIF